MAERAPDLVFALREEKHLKLLRHVSGSSVHNLYVHNIFSPTMAFSDDGTLMDLK